MKTKLPIHIYIYATLLLILYLFLPALNAQAGEPVPFTETEKNILQLLAQARESRDDAPLKTLQLCSRALRLLNSSSTSSLKVALLNEMCCAHKNLGNFEDAKRFGRRCISIATTTNDNVGLAHAYKNTGFIYRKLSDYSRAFETLEKSLNLFRQLGDKAEMANVLNGIGNTYRDLSANEKALEYYYDALDIFEEINAKDGLAKTFNNIGTIAFCLGQYDKALGNYKKALEVDATTNQETSATTLNNIGLVYFNQEMYRDALDYYSQSLKLCEKIGNKWGIADSLNNMGAVYAEMGNYKEAMLKRSKSLKLFREIKDIKGESIALWGIGHVFYKSGDNATSARYLKHSLEIAKELDLKNQIKSCYKELSLIYSSMKDYKAALLYFSQFKKVNDEIYNERSSKKIAELEVKYNTAKKEKEIGILKKDRELQKLDLDTQRNIKDSLLVISLLIVILTFVLYNRYHVKARMTLELQKEIEQHKRTHNLLRQSEEKFRILAEKSLVGIYIIQDGYIKYINPRFSEIFAYSPEELVGKKSMPDLAFEADRPMVTEKVNRKNSPTGDAVHYTFRGITKSGEMIYLESFDSTTLYHDHPAILGTTIDITDQKKTQDELLKSRKLESIGILAGGIAHDFNNLLVAIRGSMGILKNHSQHADTKMEKKIAPDTDPYWDSNSGIVVNKDSNTDTDTEDGTGSGSDNHTNTDTNADNDTDTVFEHLEKATSQAADLAQKLITFADGGWLMREKIELLHLIETSIEYLPLEMKREYKISIPKKLKPVYVDERQFRQALQCLLMNAAEADAKHQPISLKAQSVTIDEKNNEHSLKKGKYVKLSISDKGVGIPIERMSKIFDPYFSTKENYDRKGLGLGLSICYSIVKKHDGFITIESEPGKGTLVQVYIPAFSEDTAPLFPFDAGEWGRG
ncbi:MAG: tetratricopeptide repeat protein [bacterium]|nr:tetratricopeptide repeat protein [bacterium]